jgi:hypothetical protein
MFSSVGGVCLFSVVVLVGFDRVPSGKTLLEWFVCQTPC